MSNVRNVYFSDEAFKVLEEIELFDSNSKKLSRSNILNKLISDKLQIVRTKDQQDLIDLRKSLIAVLNIMQGLQFVQTNEHFTERIEKSIKVIQTIESSLAPKRSS